MKIVGLAFGVIVLAVAGLFFEAWLLGLILSWFGVTLSFAYRDWETDRKSTRLNSSHRL